jgi:hypothetical protein
MKLAGITVLSMLSRMKKALFGVAVGFVLFAHTHARKNCA